MKLNHVIGPPGTGKTSYLMGFREYGVHHAGQVEKAAAKYGANNVLCVTLTKAAAAEATSRSKILDRSRIGTLHSICFQADRNPKMVTPGMVEEFNDQNPGYQLSASEVTGSGSSDGESSDDLFRLYDLARTKMQPYNEWPQRLQSFDSLWLEFKQDREVLDFTDLIEKAADGRIDPLGVCTAFADEAQDFSALELEALYQLSKGAESLTLVGDPLQALYGWRGADPGMLIGECDWSMVLKQSFRVPREVHASAVEIVAGLPGSDAEYRPVDREGSCEEKPWVTRDPDPILSDASECMSRGESVMILASCEYMLKHLRMRMREAGIPYQNPYSPRSGQWNPLDNKGFVKAFTSFGRPFTERNPKPWSPKEFLDWASRLRARGVFLHGCKKRAIAAAELLEDNDSVSDIMNECLTIEANIALMSGSHDYLLSHLSAEDHHSQYVSRFIDSVGPKRAHHELIMDPILRPWVTLGTIHSVKGGEADNVIVFPDLSRKGARTQVREGWLGNQSLRRLMYVARTRARSRLVLCEPVSRGLSFRS